MQEGECTTNEQDSHEHINATNASMPEQSKDPLEIFRENFQLCNAGLPADYFLRKSRHASTFERYGVKSVLAAFNAKWYPKQARQEYITTFPYKNGRHYPTLSKRLTRFQNALLVRLSITVFKLPYHLNPCLHCPYSMQC